MDGLMEAEGYRAAGGWSRAGLTAEWSFEDSLGTDTAGSTDLTLVDAAIVVGANSLALDTQAAGYGVSTTIDEGLRTIQGAMDCLIKRNDNDVSQVVVLSFGSSVAYGTATDDELFISIRGNASAQPQSVQIVLIVGGVIKLSWYTDIGSIPLSGYFRLTVTGDDSGQAEGYKVFVDGVNVPITLKLATGTGYPGAWIGHPDMSEVNNASLAMILREDINGEVGSIEYEFMRLYDYVKTAEQIAEEQLLIGGEI